MYRINPRLVSDVAPALSLFNTKFTIASALPMYNRRGSVLTVSLETDDTGKTVQTRSIPSPPIFLTLRLRTGRTRRSPVRDG